VCVYVPACEYMRNFVSACMCMFVWCCLLFI